MLPTAAPLLYRELVRIAEHPDWGAREKVLALATLLERLFFEATKQEQLAFSTLFARISYAGHQYQMQPDTLRVIHQFRRVAVRVRAGQGTASDRELRLGVQAVAETVLIVCKTAIPPEVLEHLPAEGEWRFDPPDIWDYKARARVVAVRDEPEQECLVAYDDENPGVPIRVRYNLPDRNDNFNPTIRLLRTVFGFPVTLNLLEVDVDAQGRYRPRVFVVEPDYLMDVSAISECFKPEGPQPLTYLVKKFLPYESTPAILLGNIANHFLDRLLNEPTAGFPDLLRETFRLYPFVYAPMTDAEVREISNKAQKHYLNLKMMAQTGFAQQNIEPENCVLEPTFYSEQYGLQGRLDLFYHTDERSAIVELKSGAAFKPNSYGITRSHFTQTLLYDLLVRSVFGPATDPAKYILYSGAELQPLRFAPTVAPEQWEALQVRNHLVGIEYLFTRIRPGDLEVPLFQRLRTDRAADPRDFMARDFGIFESAYGKLSPLEKKYFNAFAGFIAREQWLTKVGEENSDALNGNAALWRSSFSEKQEAFAILSHLEILENRADQPDPGIVFRKTEKTNPLANFRVGDIAVLYPAETESDTVLDHQVIKCTIVELGPEHVAVQLRYRQFNLKPFETGSLWHLEPDSLDMGFVAMYRGLFEWAKAGAEVRRRVMAFGPPRVNPTPNPSPKGEGGYIVEGGNRLGDGKKKIGAYDQPQETTDVVRWRYLKEFCRGLRKFQTPAEAALWEEIRGKKLDGIKFRRQHAIEDYIADFVSLEYRFVVEVDGNIHDYQPEWDQLRTEHLNLCGFEVVRFSNEEVLNQTRQTLQKLRAALAKRKAELASLSETQPISRDQAPLPQGGGDGGVAGGASPPENPNPTHDVAPLPPGGGVGGGVFLLWGPPGTGKTSVMLRDLVAGILRDTNDNLVLLAYTNRAVDEICEALDSLGGNIREQYLRIGSRYSTAERFREQLLGTRIAGVRTRAELRAVLEPFRIVASTLASFSQNDKLLEIKKFQRLIVDEASQILEPQLIGLLTRFEHTVLIGDHRQLPAVTAQAPELTRVDDPDLHSIGLTDLRDSYFERLYRRCVELGLHQHYGQLYRQGRMHADIMDFPNEHFYDGMLKTLAEEGAEEGHYQHRASTPPPAPPPGGRGATSRENELSQVGETLNSKLENPDAFEFKPPSPQGEGPGSRVLFIPVISPLALPNQKTAPEEAAEIARLVRYFKDLYAAQGKPWRPQHSLGIITPWRAQIAQIRQAIAAAGLDPDEITIDTVERYQGGAREVILISCCVHSAGQLAKLVSLSTEGVDRKLNVALTRAREQVIMLGNPDVLREDERYRDFIDNYGI
ncbi:MAG: DUF559 domain-containing protein [Saprospiraceae bacterium]|nr:DUF559 domain-containing protein [Saprospiraceae bacterium]